MAWIVHLYTSALIYAYVRTRTCRGVHVCVPEVNVNVFLSLPSCLKQGLSLSLGLTNVSRKLQGSICCVVFCLVQSICPIFAG